MLITFSGIVGSGKSTNAKQAYRFLQEQGLSVVYLRFRFLTFGKIFQPLSEKKQTTAGSPSQRKLKKRRAHEPLRRQPFVELTLGRALGYFCRSLIFRIFAASRLRRKIVILDRFYYDSLVHYKLQSRRERFYLMLLKKALPAPNLALMLIARPQIILRRRPNYDGEYVHQLYQNYKQVAHEFPNIVILPTDSFKNLTGMIAQHLRQTVSREGNADVIQREVLQ